MKLFERTKYLYKLLSCAILEFLRCFYFKAKVEEILKLHVNQNRQLDKINCTLRYKSSGCETLKLKIDCLSMLFVLFISAYMYLANISYFALFFTSVNIFSLTVCIKHGFTGSCQIFADIYKNIPEQLKLFIFTRCAHVFNYLMRKTLSPIFCLSDEWEFSINFFQMSLFN